MNEVRPNGERSWVLTVRKLIWYGRITLQPECDESRLFAMLLGQKTLTEENIEVIKKLGYEFRTLEEKL